LEEKKRVGGQLSPPIQRRRGEKESEPGFRRKMARREKKRNLFEKRRGEGGKKNVVGDFHTGRISEVGGTRKVQTEKRALLRQSPRSNRPRPYGEGGRIVRGEREMWKKAGKKNRGCKISAGIEEPRWAHRVENLKSREDSTED